MPPRSYLPWLILTDSAILQRFARARCVLLAVCLGGGERSAFAAPFRGLLCRPLPTSPRHTVPPRCSVAGPFAGPAARRVAWETVYQWAGHAVGPQGRQPRLAACRGRPNAECRVSGASACPFRKRLNSLLETVRRVRSTPPVAHSAATASPGSSICVHPARGSRYALGLLLKVIAGVGRKESQREVTPRGRFPCVQGVGRLQRPTHW